MRKLQIEPVKTFLAQKACLRLDSLTKPQGSLGRLEEFAQRLVLLTGKEMPDPLTRKAIFTFAGDHGVVEEGVSLFPKEVTIQMVHNFLKGGAAINVLSRHSGADEVVVDIGVDYDFGVEKGLISRKVVRGTRNMRKGPAMTPEEAERCIDTGIDLALEYAGKGYGFFGTGEMGIGNTTPSSAIAAVIAGVSVQEVTGKGTGITDETLAHKIKVIEDSIALNRPDPANPVDVLAKVGGAEIGGIAGLILGAASKNIPVAVDGFISTAGALIAYSIDPAVKGYIFAAHSSVEKGHTVMLDKMGLKPILDLGLRLGEGTGAVLAMFIIEAGLKIYREMATFDEAGVSKELI
jgi:nicotinate-nucleotide--dimethylbenzimidazole phosphoribosyltransferase